MKKLRLSSQVGKAFQGRSRGFTLIEVLIAIALMGTIAITVLSALSTASLALITADKRATAESLARSQLEYVKNQGYDDINNPPQYVLLSAGTIPDDYDIVITAVRLDPEGDGTGDDDGIQKITVSVSRYGTAVITLEDYKRNTNVEE
jgi:prepilin-type N-terminal cleavage/methylation domain-containing protein